MFNWLKRTYRLIRYRQFELNRAMKNGMIVGKNSKFVGKQGFGTEPYLIKIGKNCLITNNVQFINHDGGIQVPIIRDGKTIEEVYGNYSIFGEIIIGDNVFIGVNTIILAGTIIEDNCIVGAGSIVKGKFKAGTIIAGIPGKEVGKLEEYWNKNKNNIVELRGLSPEDRKNKIVNFIEYKKDRKL